MRKGILAGVAAVLLSAATSEAQVQLGAPGQLLDAKGQSIQSEALPPPQPVPVGPPGGPADPQGGSVGPTGGPTGPRGGPVGPTGGPVGPLGGPIVMVPARSPFPEFAPLSEDGRERAWVTFDYLLWWIKPGPSPNPLVTTGSPNDTIPGALGQPGTSVLFGQHNLDFDSFSGARVTVGFWLPQCPLLGIEAGYFGLENGSVRFSAFSDANGDQVIARPIINAQTGAETSYIDSYPGAASGGVSVVARSQLDSWELNAVLNLVHTDRLPGEGRLNWDVIVGFRALDLNESIDIQDVLVPLTSGNFGFLGSAVNPPSTLADCDQFRTSNHFYGGQIGGRLDWSMGLFDVNWSAKVALGATQQVITVDGGSMVLTPGSSPSGVAGGILAQPTNIGRVYHSAFSVVPETGLNFGYQITPWLKLTVGYTFLYWTDVVRPGNQIDRTVNPSQVPTDQNFGTLTGPARPWLLPQTSDFWAQGVNFGLELRF